MSSISRVAGLEAAERARDARQERATQEARAEDSKRSADDPGHIARLVAEEVRKILEAQSRPAERRERPSGEIVGPDDSAAMERRTRDAAEDEARRAALSARAAAVYAEQRQVEQARQSEARVNEERARETR